MKLLIKFFIVSLISINAFSLKVGADTQSPVGVVIKTTAGEIHVEVYPDKAPHSSASFLKAIDNGLFKNDRGAFYRTVRPDNDNDAGIEVIQGGIFPTDLLIQTIETTLPLVVHETTKETGLLHLDGTLSLARGKGSTGSGAMFFICIGKQPTLDYGGKNRYEDGIGFSAFGTVTKGMDIVRRIQTMKTQVATTDNAYAQQMLIEPVKILETYRK